MAMRDYELHLPIYKQGDDLHQQMLYVRSTHPTISDNELAAQALAGLAEQYEQAAEMCRKMASLAKEENTVRLTADCHHIGVSGDSRRLDSLLSGRDALLVVSPEEQDDLPF